MRTHRYALVNRTSGNLILTRENGFPVPVLSDNRAILERWIACGAGFPDTWVDSSTGKSPMGGDLDITTVSIS